jgi:hypothetical protein
MILALQYAFSVAAVLTAAAGFWAQWSHVRSVRRAGQKEVTASGASARKASATPSIFQNWDGPATGTRSGWVEGSREARL